MIRAESYHGVPLSLIGHPLRVIRRLADEPLHEMSREFDRLYAAIGRPSIPRERLLRAQWLRTFYSIRSERLLMEQLDYSISFRWFVGTDMDERCPRSRRSDDSEALRRRGR